MQGPTKEVHFSLDEGQCWHSIPLSEAIDVENIRHTLMHAAQLHTLQPCATYTSQTFVLLCSSTAHPAS